MRRQPAPPIRKKSKTPALDAFSRDLTELVREGDLDPVVPRPDLLAQVLAALSRKHRPSALLVGDPGTGRRSLVHALAHALARRNSEVPLLLRDMRLVEVNVGLLVSGTRYRGQLEPGCWSGPKSSDCW